MAKQEGSFIREQFTNQQTKLKPGLKSKISDNPVIFPNGIDYDPENPDRIYLACWSSISLADLVGGAVAKFYGWQHNAGVGGRNFLVRG